MIKNLLKQAQSLSTEIGQWGFQTTRDAGKIDQLIKEYQSTLNTVQNLQSMIDMPGGTPLQKVDEDTFGIKENCGESYGGGVAGVIGKMTGLDLRGNVFKQQYEICTVTQKMRNRKFNEMIDYLVKTMASARTMGRELDNAFSAASNSGDASGNIAIGTDAARKLKVATQQFKTRMVAYDGYIEAQRHRQAMLASGAMNGHAGELRTVTDAAVMRTALCAGNRCN